MKKCKNLETKLSTRVVQKGMWFYLMFQGTDSIWGNNGTNTRRTPTRAWSRTGGNRATRRSWRARTGTWARTRTRTRARTRTRTRAWTGARTWTRTRTWTRARTRARRRRVSLWMISSYSDCENHRFATQQNYRTVWRIADFQIFTNIINWMSSWIKLSQFFPQNAVSKSNINIFCSFLILVMFPSLFEALMQFCPVVLMY